MKKIVFLLFFAVFLSLLTTPNVFATIYEFTPPNQDIFDLDHHRYYLWGINWSLNPDEVIDSITLGIDHINNWDNNDNILYMHLLNITEEGLYVGWDDQQGGDNIDSQWVNNMALGNILLDTYTDNDGGTNGNIEDYRYNFSDNDISYFNNFIPDGNFGLGFDPDCHYWNNGVHFSITTHAIPEPASIFLFSSGLLGAFLRRKFI